MSYKNSKILYDMALQYIPATTHGRLTPEQRAEANISDGLIRISVGLEDIEDLKRDLGRGLT